MAELQIVTNDNFKLPQNSLPHIEEEEEKDQLKMAPFSSLFRFATKADAILIIIGTICALAMGVALPAFAILWGNMTDKFGTINQMVQQSKMIMLNFIYIGLGAWAAGWGMFACWMIAGERQGITLRKQYLKSLLRQEIGWFDTINQSELATKFATDCFAFQGAIGQKVSTLIMTLSMFVAGFIIAFIYGWTMTLVVAASLPVIGFGGYLYSSASANRDKSQQKEYGQAGGQVQQAIAGIKTVKQLNGQSFEAEKYAETLKPISQNAMKHGAFLGLGMGTLFFSILVSYSLGFWYGSECVQGTSSCPASINGGKPYTAGNVLIVFFSILMSGFNLSQLTPAIKKIAEGRVAAVRIFKLIDRQPLIKNGPNPVIPKDFNGFFKFENVTFAYPKDKSRKILNNLNLQINTKNSAFVGESGCGKSTIFQLLMRFYDPDHGVVSLDGVDLRDIDLNWLRTQIGYVGQEPVLFATTIKENLLYGRQNATDQEIDEALKKAEAYDFVYALKDSLETYVGSGGGQVSGGQKQRLAIARAILKNPKILLLDQATSALDRRNERLIQTTLNKIAEQKVTITIAHRVKTIMKCDQIFVMEAGKVGEQGRFKDLNKYKGMKIQEEENEQQIAKAADGHEFESPNKAKIVQHKKEGEKKSEEQQQKKESKQHEQLLKKYSDSLWSRLFAYSSDKKGYFAFGILVCMANGMIFPIFSIFLSKMLAVLLKFSTNVGQARSDANIYALIFLILAIAAFILVLLQQTIFSYIGQNMTEKIRNQTYQKILKMPISWFDNPKNNSGSLSARLASDCKTVNGLITTFIAIMIQNLTCLIAGSIIAFVYQWRTSLVAFGLLPLMILSGVIQMAFTQGFSDKTDKAYKESSNLITESMINIRTVTSFGSEDIVERKYSARLVEPEKVGVRKGMISGFLYGLTQIIMFFVFGLIFYLGTVFMRDNNLEIANVFTAIYAIMFSGMTAGNNAHFMPDAAAAKTSAINIFEIQDSQDEDQLQIVQNSKLLKTPITGHIQFKDVTFKYETRDQAVFENLSFEIKPGQKVGFVGPSGCGKSTVYQLLQRFYDQNSGEVLIDGQNIRDYDIHHLRKYLGVVSQEPVLFNETIGNNIKYNRHQTTQEQIVRAADLSNFNPEKEAIQIVAGLELDKKKKQSKKQQGKQHQRQQQKVTHKKHDGVGFQKNVGVKGSHISGGQKQRVAIARVILRNPNILLLDEATSALDSANEQKVQASLDKMMTGKTSFTIAHRIDTIKNSDQILVFYLGKIVEKGNYQELMERKGYFYRIERGLELI